MRTKTPPVPYPERILPDVAVEKIPQSIGIIMDGNGRWAKRAGWERIKGHTAGIDSVREAARECARLGVKELTPVPKLSVTRSSLPENVQVVALDSRAR